MKKTILTLVCGILLWCSCKKNSGNIHKVNHELDTISANMDGVNVFWNKDSLYFYHTSYYRIWIGGQYNNSPNFDEIDFEIHSPLPIVPGTYVGSSASNLNGTTFQLAYYLAYNNGVDDEFINALDTVPPPTVTITSVTDSTIEGTFYGFLESGSKSTAIYKNITNGKFHLFTKNDPTY